MKCALASSIETYYQKFADDDKCHKRSLKARQHRWESRNKKGKIKYAMKLGILTFFLVLFLNAQNGSLAK